LASDPSLGGCVWTGPGEGPPAPVILRFLGNHPTGGKRQGLGCFNLFANGDFHTGGLLEDGDVPTERKKTREVNFKTQTDSQKKTLKGGSFKLVLHRHVDGVVFSKNSYG